ncbi:MAG: cytochrome c [Ilumatobacter sp.]|nr:cytochrome c [Ilumatobacter sp.]
MTRVRGPFTTERRAVACAVIGAALVLGACGGTDESLSEAAARGRTTAIAKGCAGCHGQNGEGGIGPSWTGLAGSEVQLFDGSVVVADDAYLVRAIKDPAADLLADYAIQMPQNELSDAEVADIVAYIKELDSDDG